MTRGVWKKDGTFRETPKVDFANDYLIVAEGINNYALSSTFLVLNSAEFEHFSPAQVFTSRNGNWMNILLTMDRKNVTSISLTYILPFIYQLDYHSAVEAQLVLTDSVHIDESTSRVKLLIAEDEFIYKTDFWELIKWAWIQYFSVFVIVYLITEKFLESVLSSIEPTHAWMPHHIDETDKTYTCHCILKDGPLPVETSIPLPPQPKMGLSPLKVRVLLPHSFRVGSAAGPTRDEYEMNARRMREEHVNFSL
ncbi:hypothetical protein WR25_12748 [Diploscapter pachys]|uniref:Transmembrane protein 231 n=1 Tax=Diploscapter pachys TaxID=2018661 RepID=A0A2A2JVF5_9BILA|nr:hypothetical protein WR25_12748 [Diploscapter pachys]